MSTLETLDITIATYLYINGFDIIECKQYEKISFNKYLYKFILSGNKEEMENLIKLYRNREDNTHLFDYIIGLNKIRSIMFEAQRNNGEWKNVC